MTLSFQCCKEHCPYLCFKCESICMDTDEHTAYSTASCKGFVCAHDWHVMVYRTGNIFGCIYVNTELCTSVLFSSISHGTSSFKTIAGHLFEGRGSDAVIIKTLVVESNIFSDQFYELLCFFLHDFADLRYGWIMCVFPSTRNNGRKRHKK